MAGKQRSISGAFLIELLIIIAVFAVCAAAGISVIAMADNELSYSEKLTEAKHISADIAEHFKNGEDASVLCPDREQTGLIVELNEHTGENGVTYLDIKVSDDKYTYTQFTCARGGGTDG